jgi:pimeloyl-ACP methyl ester carboxylesterase
MSKLYISETNNKDAPAVIFLHALATSGWMWEQVVKDLSNFNCIIPDLPGHGNSRDIKWISIADTARDIHEIIRQHAVNGKAHIVGLSFGAYIGMEVISRYPESVESAMLSGLNILPLPNPGLMNILGWLISPFIKSNFFIKYNARSLKIPDRYYDKYKQSFLQLNRHSFRDISKELTSYSAPENIAAVKCRTLLLAGEQEDPLIIQSMAGLKLMMPDVRTFIVKGVGHAWCAEDPGLFSDTVRKWVLNEKLPASLV